MENNNPSIIEGNNNNEINNFQINNNNNNNNSTSYSNQSSHDYSVNEYTLSDSDDDNESLLGILDELASIDNISRLFLSNSSKNIIQKSNSNININGIGGSSENLLQHSLSKDDLLAIQEQEELIKKQTSSPFGDHKYKKDILLCYLTLTLLIMSVLIYSLFLPNVFTNYVMNKYPNLSPDEIQNKAAYYKSFSDSIPYIFMFLFGPLFGVLSDKYGRKLMMYYGISVIVLDMITCFITIKTNNLIYFYIGHSIAGTNTVAYAAVYSFIADISEDTAVPFLYSLAGVSTGLGVVLGPVVSILTSLHQKVATQIQMNTLYVAAGLVASNLLVIPFLKESLTIAKENNKIKITKSTSNPFKLVKRIFTANGYVAFVILLFASISYTSQDIMATYFYHNQLEYGWGVKENSFYMGSLGILIMIWSAFILPFFLKRFSERKLVSVGFLVGFLTHISYSFAYSKWIWIGTTVLEAFVPNIMNLLQSVISRATPPEIKGSILTGIRSVGAIAGFLGSLVSGNVYRYFTSDHTPIFFPGAPYLLNTVIYISTFLFSLFIWRKYSNPNPLIRKRDKKKNQIIRSNSSINVQVSAVNN